MKLDAYKFWMGKNGQKPLGRRRYKREDNIKMHLEGMVWDSVDGPFVLKEGTVVRSYERYLSFGFHKMLELLNA